MDYPKAKIYTDGSHYIAIPHEEHPERRRKGETSTDDKKQAFETAYEENKTQNKAERTDNIVESIKEHFASENEAREYVERNAERKLRNLIAKRVRLWRKVNLQEWSYFATVKHFYGHFFRYINNLIGCIFFKVFIQKSFKHLFLCFYSTSFISPFVGASLAHSH